MLLTTHTCNIQNDKFHFIVSNELNKDTDFSVCADSYVCKDCEIYFVQELEDDIPFGAEKGSSVFLIKNKLFTEDNFNGYLEEITGCKHSNFGNVAELVKLNGIEEYPHTDEGYAVLDVDIDSFIRLY